MEVNVVKISVCSECLARYEQIYGKLLREDFHLFSHGTAPVDKAPVDIRPQA